MEWCSYDLNNSCARTGAKHAFQVVFNLPFEDVDCFTYADPTIVPAKTFLSQLV